MIELLGEDEAQAYNDFGANALWPRLLSGELSVPQMARFAGLWWSLVGGRARHADTAVVSHLEQEDGKAFFREMLESLEDPEKDPEILWRRFAEGYGCHGPETELPSVTEYLTTLRRFGHASAYEGAIVLHMMASQLPKLYGGIDADYFRVEAAKWRGRQDYLERLAAKYARTPYEVYQGRRAARELAFAWQCMCDDIGGLLA